MDKITSITPSRRDQSFAPSGFLGGTRVVGGACTARVCTPRRPPRLVAIVVVAIVVVAIVKVVVFRSPLDVPLPNAKTKAHRRERRRQSADRQTDFRRHKNTREKSRVFKPKYETL